MNDFLRTPNWFPVLGAHTFITMFMKLAPDEIAALAAGEESGEAADRQGEITVRTIAPASIEIVDNGPGISKETEAKLFSPFFSTKPNGQGIGLVFIREVLSRHGCTFSLRTYNDGLTRFRILFNS